jgi:hypothetical protein
MSDIYGGIESQVYNTPPFQRVEIDLQSAAGRPNGEFFAQFEGAGFYVERCDFPVLMQLVGQTVIEGQSLVVRDGLFVDADFKGFTLSHPPIDTACKLTLMIFKKCASLNNDLSTPATRLGICSRQINNTAVQQTYNIFVPPGMRVLKKLAIRLAATTLTLPSLTQLDRFGFSCASPVTITQALAAGIVTYNYPNTNAAWSNQQTPVGGFGFLEFSNIVLPTRCMELQFDCSGTGLSTPAFQGHFE